VHYGYTDKSRGASELRRSVETIKDADMADMQVGGEPVTIRKPESALIETIPEAESKERVLALLSTEKTARQRALAANALGVDKPHAATMLALLHVAQNEEEPSVAASALKALKLQFWALKKQEIRATRTQNPNLFKAWANPQDAEALSKLTQEEHAMFVRAKLASFAPRIIYDLAVPKEAEGRYNAAIANAAMKLGAAVELVTHPTGMDRSAGLPLIQLFKYHPDPRIKTQANRGFDELESMLSDELSSARIAARRKQ